MKYRETLPPDLRAVVLGHVRGYERRIRTQKERELEALRASPRRDGPAGRGRRAASDVERRAAELEKLKRSADAQSIRAVEAALERVGADIRDTTVRSKLRAAVLLSCAHGRECPYERLDVPTCSRRDFYRRRHLFLLDVARELGF